MSPEDVLQIIPDEELPQLKELLKVDWPRHIYAANFVENAINWNRKYPEKRAINFYSFEGNWKDGTFMALIELRNFEVFLYTIDRNPKRLVNAMKQTKLVKWNENPLLPCVREEIFEAVMNARNEMNCTTEFTVPSNAWWITREEALQFEWSIPPELYLANLDPSHAEIMNDVWPHKSPGSEKYVAEVIQLNGGIGLFSKETDELCCWVLKNPFNGIGLLQTAEKHKKKGYGTLITKIFSKQLAEEGYDPFGFIVQKNIVSQKLFTSIGFRKSTIVTWIK